MPTGVEQAEKRAFSQTSPRRERYAKLHTLGLWPKYEKIDKLISEVTESLALKAKTLLCTVAKKNPPPLPREKSPEKSLKKNPGPLHNGVHQQLKSRRQARFENKVKSVPTGVEQAENKVTSLKKHAYFHYNHLKSDQFKIIQNAGHVCMYERPSEVIEVIESYILQTAR